MIPFREERASGHILIRIQKENEMPPPLPILPVQVHGRRIIRVPGETVMEADGIWTTRHGTSVGVRTADCVPLLFWTESMAGAVHAGWRGLEKEVIKEFIRAAGRPKTLEVLIGPAIGPCCYEVGRDVAGHFPGFVLDGHLDLRAVARSQLAAGGIPSESIHELALCTFCSDLNLPSYRREGDRALRLVSSVSLLP